MSAVPVVEPRYTARDLLREIRRRGGRVHRMRHLAVFCLTTNPEVADWLLELGGKTFNPPGNFRGEDLGYWRDGRTEQIREWDIYIHAIPVKGEETIWEAAKRSRTVELEVIE